MPNQYKINARDRVIFLNAMKDVTPLAQKKIQLKSTSYKKNIPSSSPKKELIDFKETLSPDLVSSDEYITYKQESVSPEMFRKLRKGQYNVHAILDLHGLSLEEAKYAVVDFFSNCLQERIRVALIIHGKGRYCNKTPLLKNKLNHWLRGVDIVLAFCSASKANGGAIYVLLRQSLKEHTLE